MSIPESADELDEMSESELRSLAEHVGVSGDSDDDVPMDELTETLGLGA